VKYNSTDQVKEDEMGRACSTPGQKRNVYRILLGKPERKETLGRNRHLWKDNIRMDVEELGWCEMDLIHLVQDKYQWRSVVNTVMNLRAS
jgi:hypothetical protein